MLPIIKVPTQSLRVRSREVTQEELLSDSVQHLIDEMIPTMYGDDGIGLAAPQVAQNVRIFVVGKEALKNFDVQKGAVDTKTDLIVVNPVWTKLTKKTEWDVEGCLSVPKTYGKVKRYMDIHLEGWTRDGKPLSLDAHKFFARVIQHETDHLDGILFIDKAKDIYTAETRL